MGHGNFKRLERLSHSDINHLRLAGFKCKLKLPKSFCPPYAVFCDRPIAFKAQEKKGSVIDWWYSCEECAEPIRRSMVQAEGV
jgi:hypothetical protein